MFGLTIIILLTIIAIFGYLIMPDSTPNANDGDITIAKKPPIFSVKMLKMKKDLDVEKVSILEKIIFGEESEYTIQAIRQDPRIEGDSVYFIPFDERDKSKELGLPLVHVVKSVYIGASDKLAKNMPVNYIREGDTIRYLDTKEEIQSVTLEELEKEFWENNVEDRKYYLGTDKAGRDMTSRLMYGARISLAIGFIAVMISLAVGVTFGAIAGFFGGRIDNIVQWFMTVIWTVPTIMLVICISLALNQRGIWVAFVAVGLTMWVDIARVVRGEILAIKQKLYIESAKAFGFSNRRIIFKHILPNIFGSLIVISASNFASAILVEAGLSFLGLGVTPPTPSWGVMINEGFSAFASKDSWHLVWLPSLCISLTVLAFNLLGNGLRDAYDPRSLK
ncbi:MAG: hypothetical protein OHK0038_13000 [Flammeovirgaceae bacterium]